MKNLILSLVILASLMSCKKDDPAPATNTTPAFSIVGTWVLESAKVTLDGKEATVLRADITKGGFFKTADLETTFTADGKYSRGTETGSYTLSRGSLKLGDRSYNSFISPDVSSFVYGNRWETGGANDLQNDVFFVSQKILDNFQGTVPNSTKSAIYTFTYKKK
jgi:hypothetical protein